MTGEFLGAVRVQFRAAVDACLTGAFLMLKHGPRGILDLNGGAHLKRCPNIHEHLTKLMGQ